MGWNRIYAVEMLNQLPERLDQADRHTTDQPSLRRILPHIDRRQPFLLPRVYHRHDALDVTNATIQYHPSR